ncbi:MAP3K epsilon protein kinase 1-like [Wolffia australiana]
MSRQAATASHFRKSKTLDNKYMLGDEIGKGAYGRVYKGLDLENGDFVAIKQVSLENIPQEDLNIITQEIDLLKNLNHKNIVKYLGSSKTKTHLHIILEYVENGSLATIIKPNKFGPFPESLVAVYISQVLEGLVYLHEQGVIHRDIKGANILTTKEGLVKLADFGVATKLNEADLNTHSVVGTPYWMAPEVIEMAGVCAASDIWSVGCTVIELLTCVPPYYDLQPMPALFRIVQDKHPPLPDGLSPAITDFLLQCFKKDAMQRPDAKTLLSHPWIQNTRRAFQSSLRRSSRLRVTEDTREAEESVSRVEVRSEDKTQDPSFQLEREESRKDVSLGTAETNEADRISDSDIASSMRPFSFEMNNRKDDTLSNQDLTLAFHEVPNTTSGSLRISSGETVDLSNKTQHEISIDNSELHLDETHCAALEDEKGKTDLNEINLFAFGTGVQKVRSQKVTKPSVVSGSDELRRFSDTPGDASLEDLFQKFDAAHEDRAAEATMSTSSLHRDQGNSSAVEVNHDLASTLRARISQKKMDETVDGNSGALLQLMMGALREDVIDLDSSVFEENLPGNNLFPLQAIEFSKIVASLKSDLPEDVIMSSCQKLTSILNQRPEQKQIFLSQHGFLPLIELLEVPKSRVICHVLQVINQLIKDNVTFQENACLVGLIPIVMGFAMSDQPREVRMQAAFFFQQLCESSSSTLQMFISCRGIPILVGFLEADYAKYREMVHMAIDGMWQIFKFQHSMPRNDFCHIAAKNGILIRLVNTLHSLNEATRLAYVSSSGSHPMVGSTQTSDIEMKSLIEESEKKASLVSLEPTLSAKFSETPAETAPPRQTQASYSGNRSSIDKGPKLLEQETVRPLLSLLEKEPPSRHVSGQLEYVRHISGLERHESILPLLHSSVEKKTNGELDFLMAEFAEVSRRGRESSNQEGVQQKVMPSRTATLKIPSGNDAVASSSGGVSQTTSGVLSGSGVLNARPGSATSSGLLAQMVSSSSADVAREYLEKVADLLLEFSQADTAVKVIMCSQSLLARLFQMFYKIEPPILLKILKCINFLSADPNCLESLQRADAIRHLIPNLELHESLLAFQVHNEVLHALFNLCKINKRRQEQAAENGLVPHLLNFIMSGSPLRQFALPLLFDMAHASRNSREQLRAHGGLEIYLTLLEDEVWAVTALDSLAVCLAHDNDHRKVEQALLKKDAVQRLVKFFQTCPEQSFIHILEPFLKIITKSSRINTTLAVSGLTTLLITRLDHQDAIARLNLLKLIKAIYEHHPRPKQLIVENDLPQKLQNLIEERRDGQRSGGQVLVKQMATALLKALHINTVL